MRKIISICLMMILISSCGNSSNICPGLKLVRKRDGDVFTNETRKEIFLNKKTIMRECY